MKSYTKHSTSTLAALTLAACLLPLQPAASQAPDTAKPTTPATPAAPPAGPGAPQAIDLKAGETGATDKKESGAAVSRLEVPLFEIVAGAEDFTTLAGALRAARLDEVLREDGPFTLLAPDNEAFAALPEGVLPQLLKPENRELLKKVLRYHLISKKVSGSDLVAGKFETAQGESLTVAVHAEGKSTVQGAAFGTSDIEAKNGVIHVVKAVLIPPSINLDDLAKSAGAE